VSAGWYPDPWHLSSLRWWDGESWSGNTHSASVESTTHTEPLPWRRWIPWLVAIFAVSMICVTRGESRSVKDWVAWLVAGFAFSGLLALIGAGLTLAGKRFGQWLCLRLLWRAWLLLQASAQRRPLRAGAATTITSLYQRAHSIAIRTMVLAVPC
jgi:hypothetical protein